VLKGYYTVEWLGQGLSASQRMTAETLFAKEFEAQLGGPQVATETCLRAAGKDQAASERVRMAGEVAQGAVKAQMHLPDGRFSIRAWESVPF
jgi:hypothetical protein